jgi:hypothetical protein
MIRFGNGIEKRFHALCTKEKLTNGQMLELLMDFWELEDLDLFLTSLRTKCKSGISVADINKLSIINTYISTILKDC